MRRESQPLSATDVELSMGDGEVVKRQAVRKTLAAFPELVRRAESGGTVLYSLTDHGRAYCDLVEFVSQPST